MSAREPEPEGWVLTIEQPSPLHIGPSKVVVDGVDYVTRRSADARLMKALVAFYRINSVEAARLCDEELDRSGALLGRLREEAWEA